MYYMRKGWTYEISVEDLPWLAGGSDNKGREVVRYGRVVG